MMAIERRVVWAAVMAALALSGTATRLAAATDPEVEIDAVLRDWRKDPPPVAELVKFADRLLNEQRIVRAVEVVTMVAEKDAKAAAPLRKRIDESTTILGRWLFEYGREMAEQQLHFRCLGKGRVVGIQPERAKKRIGAWKQTRPGEYRVRLAHEGKVRADLEFKVRGMQAKGRVTDPHMPRTKQWATKGQRRK